MPDQPTGTITFLFTDIEGSTRLWEQHPAAMQVAQAQHDAILRQAIEKHAGHIVKFTGDGFHAAFANALDAVRAAIAAQQALHDATWETTGPLRVRMALHTGVAQLRADDYFGSAVNRAARLMAAGHGGQILLSLVTQELVRDHLPQGIELQDLGIHHLRDLQRPEHIFQLNIVGLPATFPPLKTLDHYPHNLPIQLTPFIGRENERQSLSQSLRLPNVRLVTLTGPGGIGKTRLALQVAADLIDEFPDGVFFIPLASITDPQQVPVAIAQELGLRESGGQSVPSQLCAFLKDKQLLLLLDNFEQVMPAAQEVQTLLATCPALKILVTSREVLRLQGEHEFLVPPLQLPDPHHLPSLETLSQFEAVELFIQRSQAVRPDFAVTNENAPAVAEICIRLDGLPLAIELAAARSKLLSPQAMLARLDDRFRLLRGGARDLPARQQTLQATIDWSYNLLADAEKILFRRLAIFVGGHTLEAAEAVCQPLSADEQLPPLEIDIFDGLISLLDKSLIRQMEEIAGEPRFGMLTTIREYALERLGESDELPPLSRRHTHYFRRLVQKADTEMTGAQEAIWLDRLEAERGNLRAVLRRVIEQQDTPAALELAATLWWFWVVRGHYNEGRAWVAEILALPATPADQGQRAKVLNGAGALALRQGDYAAARAFYEESVAILRTLGQKAGLASSLNNLGVVAHDQGDYTTARTLWEESVNILRALNDKPRMAALLINLGRVVHMQGDLPAARALFEESLALARELGDQRGIAAALHNLALVTRNQDDLATAESLETESLEIFKALGDRQRVAYSLHILAGLALDQGTPEKAHALEKESLEIFKELGDKRGLAAALHNLGNIAFEQGQEGEALTLYRESLALQHQLGNQHGIAMALESFARLAGTRGYHEPALILAGAAASIRRTLNTPPPPSKQAILEQHIEQAHTVLGPTETARWLTHGESLSLDEAVTFALDLAFENSYEQSANSR